MIALADLAEAEGRALRQSILKTGLGIVFLTAAALLLVLGLGFSLWGLYTWLAASQGAAAAAAIIGFVALVLSGGLAWTAIRLGR